MYIRFLSYCSTGSSRSASVRLKYNLAGETIDSNTLLVKYFHIVHIQELHVAAGGETPQTDAFVDCSIICTGSGSPPIPNGTLGQRATVTPG